VKNRLAPAGVVCHRASVQLTAGVPRSPPNSGLSPSVYTGCGPAGVVWVGVSRVVGAGASVVVVGASSVVVIVSVVSSDVAVSLPVVAAGGSP
jgi:hypothetical protein